MRDPRFLVRPEEMPGRETRDAPALRIGWDNGYEHSNDVQEIERTVVKPHFDRTLRHVAAPHRLHMETEECDLAIGIPRPGNFRQRFFDLDSVPLRPGKNINRKVLLILPRVCHTAGCVLGAW